MTRREIREEIFKLLFEKELTDNNVEKRIEETIKEIIIKKVGYEIAINEAVELAKKYSYDDTKEFLNGILAKLVKQNNA